MRGKSSRATAGLEMPPFGVASARLPELAAVSRHGVRLGVLGTPQHFEMNSIRKHSDRDAPSVGRLGSVRPAIGIAA